MTKPTASICVCTYRRPEKLYVCLRSLIASLKACAVSAELIVVDNDANEETRVLVHRLAGANTDISIRYVAEPSKGLAQARNSGIHAAQGRFIGFFDDDQWCRESWLSDMINVIHDHEADGVFSSVLPSYSSAPPKWVLRHQPHQREIHRRGHSLDWRQLGSGSCLLSRQLVEEVGEFQSEFSFSGGEDSDYFFRAQRLGFSLKASGGNIAFETIDGVRLKRLWVLKRSFNGGSTYIRILSHLDQVPNILDVGFWLVRGTLAVALGGVLWTVGWSSGFMLVRCGIGDLGKASGRLGFKSHAY